MTRLLLLTMLVALVGEVYIGNYYTAMWVFISLALFVVNIVTTRMVLAQHEVLMDIKERIQHVNKTN
jgi:fatty acid desaturase